MTQSGTVTPPEKRQGPTAFPEALHRGLASVAEAGGPAGWLAQRLLTGVDLLEDEVTTRQQMTGGIDAMWVSLESTSSFNPVCAATFTFKGAMTLDKIIKAYEEQGDRFPKYRQRLTNLHRKLHGPTWQDDPDFDIKKHVEIIDLPEPAGKVELEALMGDFIARRWDYNRPLWDTVLITNYKDDEGAESAMLTRGHHSLSDGQGFIMSQLYCTDFRAELVELMDGGAAKLSAARRGTARPSSLHPALRFLDPAFKNPLLNPFVTVFLFSLFWALWIASAFSSIFWSIYLSVHSAWLIATISWRVVMVTPPQPGDRVEKRVYATSRRMGMADIKKIQRAFSGPNPDGLFGAKVPPKMRKRSVGRHVTVNDVFVSAMSDVLSDLVSVRMRTQPWPYKVLSKVLPNRIGFFIPISVREPGDWAMRNLSSGALVYCPMGSSDRSSPGDIWGQIHATKGELNVVKKAGLPRWVFPLFQWTGQAPIFVPMAWGTFLPAAMRRNATLMTEKFLAAYHAILTNVPGPAKRPVNFSDIEVISWTALPPQAGKGVLALGVISYANAMCISVAADCVPGAEGIAREICERFEKRFNVYLQQAEKVLARG